MPENKRFPAGERGANQSNRSDGSNLSNEAHEALAQAHGSITFLQSKNRRRMAKRFYKDGLGQTRSEPYAKEKVFKILTGSCRNIFDLAIQIKHAEKYPYVCIVRGAPADTVDRNYALRRSRSKPNEPATFLDVPRPFVMLDIDKIPCPPATDPIADPVDAALYVAGLLPFEFRDVSFYWQFSSSQSVYGNDTLSLHIWFYLDRPYTNAELRKYANAVNKTAGYKLIDPALFSPVQPHYIARPLFEDGIRDPLPVRSGFWRGLEDDATLNISTLDEGKPAYKSAVEYHQSLGYEGSLASIGSNTDGFRRPIISCIASYVATHGIDGTDQEAVKNDIRTAIRSASHGNRTADEIKRYESDKFLDDIFEWVLMREQEKARPQEIVKSLRPYYPYPAYANAEKDKAAVHMKERIAAYINQAVRQIVATKAQRIVSEFDHCDDHAA